MTRIHYTLPGTKLPSDDLRSPTLLFHKWQGWDRFEIEWKPKKKGGHDRLDDFERNDTGVDFLQEIATAVELAGQQSYRPWYDRLAKACDALDAEKPFSLVTTWRMVVGWATNPALETGLTLEPFHGFPYVPGSAVKGLLHRMAELELAPRRCPPPPGTRLHSRPVPLPPRAPASPEEPPVADGPPPAELEEALTHALRLRALFGSLHLRPGTAQEPATALVALEGWRDHAHRLVERRAEGAAAAAWKQILPRLETVCSATAAGGLVTCFDAVPARSTFDPPPGRTDSDKDRKLLEVDVLTPHGTKTAILFLAVRDGARFEVRWRLAPWPSKEPRDPAEEARAEALAGLSREEALKWLDGWLRRGVTEHGLGGKTSSGYGYLYPPEDPLRYPAFLEEPPPPVEPEPEETEGESERDTGGGGDGPKAPEPLTDAEKEALKVLPDGIDINRASDVLDKTLKAPPSEVRTATVARFAVLFPNKIDDWDSSPAPKYQKRMRQIREILGDGAGGDA